MVAKVLDSWALMAFFKGEPAGATVEVLLQKATDEFTALYEALFTALAIKPY